MMNTGQAVVQKPHIVQAQIVSSEIQPPMRSCRAELPPVRFHDLRHGAASLYKAAGVDTKPISAMLGHSRTSFTDATYVLVFPEVAKAAAEAAAAVVPRVSGRADKRSSGSYPEGR